MSDVHSRPPEPEGPEVTRLLHAWRDGDRLALDDLLPLEGEGRTG